MTTQSQFLYQNTENPNEIIKSPWGDIPAWKASAMATGTMGAYDAFIKQAKVAAAVINDSLDLREQEVSAREDAVAQREREVTDLIGQAAHMCDRINRRLDEEEEHRRGQELEEPCEDPPGFTDEAEPGGELHVHPAKDPENDPRTAEPDDEDAGEVLQQSPLPSPTPGDPNDPHERPTELEED
jgi:hypothetical protein